MYVLSIYLSEFKRYVLQFVFESNIEVRMKTKSKKNFKEIPIILCKINKITVRKQFRCDVACRRDAKDMNDVLYKGKIEMGMNHKKIISLDAFS